MTKNSTDEPHQEEDPGRLATELAAETLATGGSVRLATLVAELVGLDDLRALAKKFGLSPKGYRIDKAPPAVLAAALTERKEPAVVDAVCEALEAAIRPAHAREPVAAPKSRSGETDREPSPLLALRERELEHARSDLARARDAADRQRRTQEEFERLLRSEREQSARLRAEITALRRRLAEAQNARPSSGDETRRIHELEREVEDLEHTESALRRRIAEQNTEIRSLRGQVDELAELVPKGRRRKAPPPPPPLPAGFRLPHFTREFYKSLESKDRRSIEQAIHAVLRFCTEGPSYPGLVVKQLEGLDLWSLRASVKLRVYFRLREDGDVDVLHLGDREDQDTWLKRFRER